MKKIISVILCLVMAFGVTSTAFAAPAGESSFGAYKHVFIIGIDGAGRFFKENNTPNFDRIFADGAVKYDVRTEVPSDSGPNWASMLTGVSYYKHWIHNGNSGEEQRTSDTRYPTVFTYARRAYPDCELASFCNWDNINFGMIETDINVTKVHVASDPDLTTAICDYFDAGNAPAIFFVQLDDVDAAGHGYGSESEQYKSAIERADGYIGRIYDAVERNGLMEDGLFIVTADHGHTIRGGHGRFSMRESTTTIAAVGKTVVAGGQLDRSTRDRDIAAITLYALGIKQPFNMSARLPGGLFENTKGKIRNFIVEPLDSIISPFMWIVTLLYPDV